MENFDSDYQFIDFTIKNNSALSRLSIVTDEFQLQKRSAHNLNINHWLPYFSKTDLQEFWWPTDDELKLWHSFYELTPETIRFSKQMPSPPWGFESMYESILQSEYDIIGIKKLDVNTGRLEFSADTYPYGGVEALGILIISFGHKIIGYDDGTGYRYDDTQESYSIRWTPDMKPKTKRGLLDFLASLINK